MILKRGSLVFTSAKGFVSSMIRLFEQDRGESPSWVSHVGIVVKDGTIFSAVIIEALTTVKMRYLAAYHNTPNQVAVFEPVGFSPAQIDKVVSKAMGYKGRGYGWLKILAHAADRAFGGRYMFRKWCSMDRYPICSWVTAFSYDLVGYRFMGKPPEVSQPDDQWDDVLRSERWKCVLPLQRI